MRLKHLHEDVIAESTNSIMFKCLDMKLNEDQYDDLMGSKPLPDQDQYEDDPLYYSVEADTVELTYYLNKSGTTPDMPKIGTLRQLKTLLSYTWVWRPEQKSFTLEEEGFPTAVVAWSEPNQTWKYEIV